MLKGLLTAIIVLKILGYINCSWWWILTPISMFFLWPVLVWLFVYIVLIFGKKKEEK
jgi:hypothetical protein